MNWGTFDRQPWVLNLNGDIALLTGGNGSGKSTLVDALLTLLVPNKRRNYNQASSGSGKKERDEKSYIQGAYGRVRAEDSYGSKPKFLREKGQPSILLAYFSDRRTDRDVTPSDPCPNLYIRELPIRVHTKFIEQNKGILREILEIIIPSNILVPVDDEKDRKFEKRFSLKYPEPIVRLRLLDNDLKARYNFPAADISLPSSDFIHLDFDSHQCSIVENLMNFLTLPYLQNSIALFGKGYAVSSLKTSKWLLTCPIFYWGDMDVDGFKILSQLRSYFPQVRSVMMDMETYQAFQEFAVSVETPITKPPAYLTESETTVYTYLVSHHQRLEQERITQEYANKKLQKLI